MHEFRKSYGQLDTLRIVLGSQVPFGAASATLATSDFETVFKTLRMGVHRAFWGLDLGTDRPNLRYDVRRMAHPIKSCRDLLSLLPAVLQQPSDLPKTIIYFPDKRSCRVARDILRAAVPAHLRQCIYPFYASHSEGYKDTLLRELHSGRKLRLLLATNAAGMGLDIPDVMRSVIYGARRLSAAFQEGGRAVRDPKLSGAMIWFVPDWMFSPPADDADTWLDDNEEEDDDASDADTDDSSEHAEPSAPESASAKKNRARRNAFDPAAIKFVNLAGSETCMRRFVLQHCRPHPQLPGFTDRLPLEDGAPSVEWEVTQTDTDVLPPKGSCCSARCCQVENEDERAEIRQAQTATGASASDSSPATKSSDKKTSKPPAVRCSQAERQALVDVLLAWQDQEWSATKAASPGIVLLGRSAVLTRNQLNVLVSKAHHILGAETLDSALVRELAHAHLPPDEIIALLVSDLDEFWTAFFRRHPKAGLKRKKAAGAIET
jgi:hypothetical protein